MNEAFDEWKVPKTQIGPHGYSNYFDEWYQRDVTNFVHRDRNHPSVVLWSAGNEIGDQSAPNGADTLRKLLAVFHTEDPTQTGDGGLRQHCLGARLAYRAGPSFWRCSTWWATTMWTAGATASRSITASTGRRFRKDA